MQTSLMSYADVLSHVIDYLGADATAQTERFARRAIQMAVNDMHSKRQWKCFFKRGRIVTSPAYQDGTIAYLATSGAIPRQVTLTGGTWPSWAADGTIRIGNVVWPIAKRVSNSVVQLQSATASQEDIASTVYMLSQETYPLPVDFADMGEIFALGYGRRLVCLTPNDFYRQQSLNISPAFPHSYCIQGDPRRYGSLSIFMYPAPDNAYTMDYSYRRQSRALSMHGASPVVSYQTGKATVTSASTTVTGTSTLWTADMVGCVMRFAGTPNGNVPTGQSGSDPFFVQRTVTGWTSATSLEIDQVTGVDLTAVPFSISDPVDLEMGAMMTYFLRECEKQARIVRRIKPEDYELKEYQRALVDAMEADQRNDEPRSTFGGGPNPLRIANMPVGPPKGA